MPLYAHVSGVHPDLGLFKVRYSSSYKNAFLQYKADKTTIESLNGILKLINPQLRSYDPDTQTWMFAESMFEAVLRILKSILTDFGVVLHTWDDFDKFFALTPSTDTEPSPEDFFKQGTVAPQKQLLSKDDIRDKLYQLCDILFTDTEPKKAYRQAAMKLHPDRNNGDGTKMAELNVLWQEYQKYV